MQSSYGKIQGTLFAVNGSLRGKNGGKGLDDSFIFQQSKTDRLLDYRRISILPSTARRPARSRAGKHDFWEEFLVGSLLKDKQQQSNDRKEALATKALQAVVNKIDQFDGRNISRKLTLEPNKVDLFLQVADGEFQEKLESLLEDKEEDERLTTKWKNVEDVVGLLIKKEMRKDRSNIPKTVQAPKAPVRTTPPTMPTVQPSTSLSKKADMGMEEIIRGMRDLQIKLARLEENTSINNWKNVSKQGYGGMRALLQDYLKEHETAARESASYGARVDDEIGGSTKTSEFWASAVSTMQEGKLPREALLRTSATIRGRTGWEDPVESLSVHAYIAKSQHEALMEEKRRRNFDDTREGNSFKRQTRGDKAREAASQELPVKDTSASLGEKTTETKDKGKSIAYKLLFDMEAATNLKGVLEERILNAKVEFTLKEVLEIAKKEFHDVIIDSIKRKRQLMSETGMSHAIDARICRDEEEVDIGYKQPTNEKNGYNQRVRFEDSSDKEMETLSHYTRKHWARQLLRYW
uniref:Predicted protein n=1 Tax=Physcomitrium patens TaxID=3218 RepID=A9U482_PHYPA